MTSASLPADKESVPPARQLLDCELDPPGCTREQADVLEHDQRRHRHRTERAARLGDRRRHVHDRSAPLLCQPLELPTACDGYERCTGLERLAGRLDGLFCVAGERDRENEGSPADEVGELVRLDHRDRYRKERAGDGNENISREAASTHAEHDHLLDVLAVGQSVEVSARTDRGRDLLGQRSGRLEACRCCRASRRVATLPAPAPSDEPFTLTPLGLAIVVRRPSG